jgi:hypothetical protein
MWPFRANLAAGKNYPYELLHVLRKPRLPRKTIPNAFKIYAATAQMIMSQL